jgi:hypothetical protein
MKKAWLWLAAFAGFGAWVLLSQWDNTFTQLSKMGLFVYGFWALAMRWVKR